MSCQVYLCRYNDTHITIRHCCGTCKMNGHGQMECSRKDLINELKEYNNDIINNPCTIPECQDKNTHNTKGHSCLYCDKRGIDEHLNYCPNNKNTHLENSICDNLELFNSSLKEHIDEIDIKCNEYKISNGGMGCVWLIRNNNNIKEYLFMHTDCWGQYGEETSHLPRYKAFIYGYNLVEEDVKI